MFLGISSWTVLVGVKCSLLCWAPRSLGSAADTLMGAFRSCYLQNSSWGGVGSSMAGDRLERLSRGCAYGFYLNLGVGYVMG